MNGYRPDIDGLRAVAVLAVVLFHGVPGAVSGGFVGVDLFFVISGFLITGIILGDLEQQRFSIAGFYSRRIRRIFPALLLVLAATLVVGWLAQLPMDFRQLGRHVSAGAGFVANLLLWRETGDYFQTAAKFKPTLHLWSLGVEEQYYLLWPLLLSVLRGRRALPLIITIALLSFAANLWSAGHDPMDAFYLPQCRFWELMFGGALAYAALHGWRASLLRPLPRELLAWLGAALVGASLFVLDERQVFPGWRALPPVLGATLLIFAGPDTWLSRRVLANRVAVYVGLISYPLYLWHWPLLSFLRVVNDQREPAAWARLTALGCSVVLAILTYELVEKRVRFRARVNTRPLVIVLAGAMAAIAVCGMLAYAGIIRPRAEADPRLIAISQAMHDWDFRGNRTIAGAGDTVLLAGDSMMQQWVPRADVLAGRAAHPTIVIQTQNGCLPVIGIERPGRWRCNDFATALYERASQGDVRTVVLAGAWSGRDDFEPVFYRLDDPDRVPLPIDATHNTWVWDELGAAVRRLVQAGKQVVIVLEPPRGSIFDPYLMAVHHGLRLEVQAVASVPRAQGTAFVAAMNARLKQLADSNGARWLDPADWLCNAAECRVLDAQGAPVYRDLLHLRAEFARRLPMLDGVIAPPAAPPGDARHDLP